MKIYGREFSGLGFYNKIVDWWFNRIVMIEFRVMRDIREIIWDKG